MTPPTPKEPEAISELRSGLAGSLYEGCGGYGCYNLTWHMEDVLAAYDTLAAERDAWEREAVDGREVLAHHVSERDYHKTRRTEMHGLWVSAIAELEKCDDERKSAERERDAMKAERDAAESLVSAQHDALVAMKAERDWWEHRAEVAERENGEALAMLAFTGEPSSLWQAAAARVKMDAAVQREQNVRDRARRAAQRLIETVGADGATNVDQAAERACAVIDELRAKLDALTAHMNQVHETLGGSDTVLTLEAAQHVVAKLAEAERERDRKASWVEELADIISRGRAENVQLREKLAEAEKDRGDANDALAACQAQAAGTIARLREALDEWEDSALNLLAVVHRDGGQHTATVGFSASCTEAEAAVVALRAKLAEAEKDAARYRWLMADSKRRDRIWEHVLWDTERGEHHSLAAAIDHARTAATAKGDSV